MRTGRHGRYLSYHYNAAYMLIFINIGVFVLQTLMGHSFTESFMLVSQDAFSRPWILLTSMFLHANSSHILFNMYALFIFGPLVEQKIGSKRFLSIYFTSGILASLISTMFYPATLGASGAIMGILGVTIMILPNLPVLLFFMIPMTLRTAGIIFALIDIFGIFVPTGIANIAHLVGLSTGLIFGYYLVKKRKSFTKKFISKPKRKFRQDDDIEMSQDEIDDYMKYGKI